MNKTEMAYYKQLNDQLMVGLVGALMYAAVAPPTASEIALRSSSLSPTVRMKQRAEADIN